jgi:ribosome biogenesis GTPase
MKGIEELKAMMIGKVSMFSTFRCWEIDFSQCYGTYFASKNKDNIGSQTRATHDDFAEMYDLSFDARIIDTLESKVLEL